MNKKLENIKDKLLELKNPSKEEVYPLLLDLDKYSPDKTREVVQDYTGVTLLIGWKKTKALFQDLWIYILDDTSNDDIKRKIRISIKNILQKYMDKKHGHDPLYQRWVKMRLATT